MKKLSDTYKELGIDFTFPIYIKDVEGNRTYYEDSDGLWSRWEYDANGNVTYYEDSNDYWRKSEYDVNGNLTYYETRSGDKEGTPRSQSCAGKFDSPRSHVCDECQGLLDGYFTGRMNKDGFDVRMECQKCGKEEAVKFSFVTKQTEEL